MASGHADSTPTTDLAHARLVGAYEQLQGLFNALPVGFVIYDCDLRVVRVNRLIAEWNGVTLDSAIGQHVQQAFPWQWAAFREFFERALGGEAFAVDIDRGAYGMPTGPAQELVYFAPVSLDDVIVGLMVCATDATVGFQKERELALAHARLQSVFESAPVGIAAFDADLRLTHVNRHMADWAGLTQDLALGMHASSFTGHVWPTVQPAFARALGGEPSALEYDRRSQGVASGPAHISVAYAPIRLGTSIVGVTVTATDITARVERERAVEAAARFEDDVIHIASHELRTPLTSILGISERLVRAQESGNDRPLDPPQEDLRLIFSESARMARTLDFILDMVGLAVGSTPMDQEPIALIPLVRRQIRLLQERYPEIHIEEKLPESVVVESDGDRVAQILTNLLENAAKYAGQTCHLTVRVHAPEGSRGFAAIDVQDDGPGIRCEEQESIFDSHYRGHANDDAKGLGLGLYLSRVIAGRLGGTLTVDSVPGQGATFTLRLPLPAQDSTRSTPAGVA